MSWGMATCRSCGEPLIATFAFSGKEFICLCCGRLYEFLEPVGVPDTPEVTARQAELQAEWDEHAGPHLLSGGGMRLDSCKTCKAKHEPHIAHATEEELAAHTAAVAWIKERSSREAVR